MKALSGFRFPRGLVGIHLGRKAAAPITPCVKTLAIRGILKTFGLVVGSGNKGAFAQRARMLAQDHPILSALVEKLLDVREVAAAKVAVLGRRSAETLGPMGGASLFGET
jgi:hypothetical protein